ncbi:hypothetical protein [Rhodococcus sp. IEGM 1408]|uniref:hypothetical protein n=1 Tax=Rhodococcus sp. IEGM 1408 TaxID=3082220 RepID=UPI0029533B05|nr:hypothetical protein [Rhodococcus sp. IEGM 1408]MDV8001451.1 hypothetical protein [Rhodococcus sp. IEGM 1408]
MSFPAPQRKSLPASTAYVLIGALIVVIALLAVIVALLLNAGSSSSSAASGGNDSAEPGSGPEYKGKRPSDIGANFSDTISFNGVQMSASPVEFNLAKNSYSSDAYCTTVTIANSSDAPFEVGAFDFAMHSRMGQSKTPNELNDVDRLEDQVIPVGGSTLGSLCYAVPFNDGQDDPDFSYQGVGLGGTRLGWTSGR